MTVDAVGDPWTSDDVEGWAARRARRCSLGARRRPAPLPLSTAPTVAALARDGRRLLLDAQGIDRVARVGPLGEDADIDRGLLRAPRGAEAQRGGGARSSPAGSTLERSLALGVPEVVLTLGSQGARVVADGELDAAIAAASGDGRVDPTGAGDAFSLVYVDGRASGLEPVAAAERAARGRRPSSPRSHDAPARRAARSGRSRSTSTRTRSSRSATSALDAPTPPALDLPLLVAAAAHGSTVVAVVDRRPPLVVSNDGGRTWREAGAGLAPASRSRSRPSIPTSSSSPRPSGSTSRATAGASGRRSRSSCPSITAVAFG